MNWFDLSYLATGSEIQRKAFSALETLGVMDILKPYSPVLAGTIPLNMAVKDSDLDILCHVTHSGEYRSCLARHFSRYSGYRLYNDQEAILCSFCTGGFPVEIYGATAPVMEQNGYVHLDIEYRLLQIGGQDAYRSILQLKREGLKTEPAFAKYFHIEGDPYKALLLLSRLSDSELKERFTKNEHAE